MPTYDATGFEPPASVAHVTVRRPADGASAPNVPLLIDTGADVSLLPAPQIGSLMEGLESETRFELEGFDGT